MTTEKKTHFGYEEVTPKEKTSKVKGVFDSVAKKYDIMNDLMSFGIHRIWKRQAVAKCNLKPGNKVLDLAGGTGDLSQLFAKKVGATGTVILSDINHSMLVEGQDKLVNNGIIKPVSFLQTNAESISLPSNYFDCVSIAFGLRNVTNKEQALKEMFRVLKPGGRVMILEFSQPKNQTLSNLYDFFSFNILPSLGEIVANDKESYQYLVESIRMHPDQETLLKMLNNVGFEDTGYDNLTNGICAIHYGIKY